MHEDDGILSGIPATLKHWPDISTLALLELILSTLRRGSAREQLLPRR